MQPKGMEDLAAFSAREVKRAAAEEKKETSILLQINSESHSKKQAIPASFLKIERRGTVIGAEDRREKDR